MKDNHLDREILQLLSQYFSTRGEFLAQVIRADLRTLPHQKLISRNHSDSRSTAIEHHHRNGNAVPCDDSNGSTNGVSNGNLNGHGHYFNQGNNNGNHGDRHHENGRLKSSILAEPVTAFKPSSVDSAVLSHQPVSPQPVPIPVPTQSVYDQVVATLVNLIVDKTGYPKDSIGLDSRLLDDLNLDSIKAGEVVALTAKQFGVTGDLEPAALANATLAEVAKAICDTLPKVDGGADRGIDALPLANVPPGKNISQMLLNLVEASTGFPQSSLTMEMRLLDDLNLDSIKAADLVARAAKQLGIDGQLDPSSLANATLADVVIALEDASALTQAVLVATSKAKSNLQSAPLNRPTLGQWVRNFAVEYVEAAVPTRSVENWSQAQVRLIADTADDPFVAALGFQIRSLGGEVSTLTFAELLSTQDVVQQANDTHIVAVLPQPVDSNAELSPLPLESMIARLKSVAILVNNSPEFCLAYVQFGGGYFGTQWSDEAIAPSPESCCAAAFARSLHLERLSLRVRVIDLCATLSPTVGAELVMTELSGADPIVTAGYDVQQVRRVPQSQLQQPVDYTPREQSWTSDDVILVTGGAKGITAECALAIAESTGAKMALVGRSPLPTPDLETGKSEIIKTLDRYRQRDLSAQYYCCDITNLASVEALLQTIKTDLGPVTGVIHGAGLNTPRRVEQVSLESAQAEVSPKLIGAQNLLQTMADCPPKLFLAFTSIIGVTGMPGNSWYGFANETLNLLLQRFAHLHPETQIISLAYSVWDEVGMGARMGSVKNLERMGIGAISPQEGIERCVKLFHRNPGVQQVVIAAPLGGLDTWSPLPQIATDNLRFIEQIRYLEPGVELTVRTHLNLERDLYIKDHIWRGSYLFPTVFGLEAMAQAAAVVVGETEPAIARFENISLRRPVVVDPNSGVVIEIHAEVAELNAEGERAIKVGIRTEQTGFQADHFSATLVLGKRQSSQPLKHELGQALAIEPKRDLYGSLLFQGNLFQQMDQIFSLSREQSLLESHAQTSTDLQETGFPIGHGSAFLLGDPYFRDVLLQCMQLNIPQDICLPVEIKRIDFCQNPATGEGRRLITAILKEKIDKEYICEVIATNELGAIVEHLQGYRLRILEEHPENPTAAELAMPEQRDQMNLQQALSISCNQMGLISPIMALGYAPALGAQSKKKRRQVEKSIVERAIQKTLALDSDKADLDFAIRTHRSGQPYLTGKVFQDLKLPPSLSLSHDDHYCICSVAATPQGCDIESIEHRSQADWVALLSQARSTIVNQLIASGDDCDVAGTRVWSALEATHKAFNGLEVTLQIEQREGSVVLLKAQTPQANYYVLTLPLQLTRHPKRMLAVVVEQSERGLVQVNPLTQGEENYIDPYGIIRPGEHRTRITEDGPQNQPVYEKRFPVTFKEGCSISRKVTVSQYISWVGKIRELPMRSMAEKLIPDFLSGQFGMVTNSVSLRVLGEATTYDTIQARCWLGNLVNSSFATYIEFCKVLSDQSLERIAMAEVNATWVRLLSYGIPSPEAMPDYLQDYMAQFAAKSPAAIDLKESPTDTLQALPSSLTEIDLGPIHYQSPQVPYGDLIFTEVFQTTLEEANLVGNVYYGNYFIWQGRAIDLFLYSLAPQYFRVSTAQGEVIPLYSHMNYMREAMPFDKVRVHLYLQQMTECGAVFNFEFFRELPNQELEKLHTGAQEVIWANRQANGTPIPAPWPEAIRTAMLKQQLSTPLSYAISG